MAKSLDDVEHMLGVLDQTLLGIQGSVDDTNERLEELIKLMKELIRETKRKSASSI